MYKHRLLFAFLNRTLQECSVHSVAENAQYLRGSAKSAVLRAQVSWSILSGAIAPARESACRSSLAILRQNIKGVARQKIENCFSIKMTFPILLRDASEV